MSTAASWRITVNSVWVFYSAFASVTDELITTIAVRMSCNYIKVSIERKKTLSAVDPDTKAVINEDSLAPSTGGNSSHSTPTSSNRSTPVPQAVSDHSQVLVNKPSSHISRLLQVIRILLCVTSIPILL